MSDDVAAYDNGIKLTPDSCQSIFFFGVKRQQPVGRLLGLLKQKNGKKDSTGGTDVTENRGAGKKVAGTYGGAGGKLGTG
jgi:hypothetical protein